MTIDAKAVAAALTGTRFGSIEVRPETGSTNDDAAAILGRPDAAGHVIVADFQREGRGRHARSWIAPVGSSLLFTAILPAPLSPQALWSVPFWCALGVADGIAQATQCNVSLQWPNDILLGGRKVCGILATSRVQGERAWVGCGVGVNVSRPNDAALASILPPPAFLSDEAPRAERAELLIAVLQAFDARLEQLNVPTDIAAEWERRANLAGTPYRIVLDGETAPFDAVARGLAGDGSLVVEADGVTRRIALADARVLR